MQKLPRMDEIFLAAFKIISIEMFQRLFGTGFTESLFREDFQQVKPKLIILGHILAFSSTLYYLHRVVCFNYICSAKGIGKTN